jgi:hypothetical protein
MQTGSLLLIFEYLHIYIYIYLCVRVRVLVRIKSLNLWYHVSSEIIYFNTKIHKVKYS